MFNIHHHNMTKSTLTEIDRKLGIILIKVHFSVALHYINNYHLGKQKNYKERYTKGRFKSTPNILLTPPKNTFFSHFERHKRIVATLMSSLINFSTLLCSVTISEEKNKNSKEPIILTNGLFQTRALFLTINLALKIPLIIQSSCRVTIAQGYQTSPCKILQNTPNIFHSKGICEKLTLF